MIPLQSQQWRLRSRPVGSPTLDNFEWVSVPLPPRKEGELLLKTLYLSLDPYMRGRLSDGPSYAEPVKIGEVILGGTVSQVVESFHPNYQPGDVVLGANGWQSHAISDGRGLMKIDGQFPSSYSLGVLGMPGFTAYMGLLDIGQPKSGETLVVAAATGAVGSLVGQIAKIKGCRTIGIAGGEEKCRYAVEHLGFDACLDHHLPELRSRLSHVCPQGIDIYYENVGGKVFDAVLPLLNSKARIPVCGLIAHYNDTELPPGPDRTGLLMRSLLVKRIRMQGFIIFEDYAHQYPEFLSQMRSWLQAGKIQYREDVVSGLENAPASLIGLLQGNNFGKLLIQVSTPS